DDCDSNPTVTFNQTSTQDANATHCGHYSYTITRTWTAHDVCGNNSATATQVITVQDTTAPTISAAGANATINCPATPSFTPPTATDNCDPAPQIVEVSDVTTPGACAGTYTRTKTWKAVDACNNASGTVSQTITVQDVTAPALVGVPSDTTVQCNAVPAPATVTATDDCDSNPTVTFNQTSTQDANATHCGHYSYTITRTWTAHDVCGNNSATATQAITVQDTTAPTISAAGPNTTINCPGIPSFTPP